MRRSLYRRPNRPMTIAVRNRTAPPPVEINEISAPLIIDKTTECHVTPQPVAARMVEYLGPQGDYLTLEPSAGTGALIDALLKAGHSPRELVAVERHNTLAARLNYPGAGIINRCFLEYAGAVQGAATFPRIIMNPPFGKVRQHISAALSLLGRGGHDEPAVLVALVPITYTHDRAETLEILPDSTFSVARVNTKIIRINSQ